MSTVSIGARNSAPFISPDSGVRMAFATAWCKMLDLCQGLARRPETAEVASRYLAMHGGPLSDSMEREIFHHVSGGCLKLFS